MNTLGLTTATLEPAKADQRLLAVAGLLTSAFVAWILVAVLKFPKDVPLFLTALVYILAIVGANALAIHVVGGILQHNVEGLARRVGATVAWLAPLAVYLHAGSLLSIPLAIFAMIRTIALFRSFEHHSDIARTTLANEMFQFPDPPPMTRLLSLVCAGACIEATVAAGAAQTMSMAVFFASTSSGIIGWQMSEEPKPAKPTPHFSRDLISSGLTLAVAFLLTMGAMGSGSGDGDTAAGFQANGSGGAYWGVILWPEHSTKPIQLVAVPANPAMFDKGLRLKVKIPFDGVYWFFRSPESRPPRGSVVAYGTPDEIGFRSTDATPLVMEAHQFLANHLDLTCCTAMEVTVRNAETIPGSVTMEIVLMDSSLPFQSPLSLGEVAVTSTQPLHFPIPETLSIPTFDQVTVRFHLEASRETVSPRIAIVDFVMVPR